MDGDDGDDGEGDIGDDEWWMVMTVIMVMMVTVFEFKSAQHSGAEYSNTNPAPIHHSSHPARCGPYRCTTQLPQ